MTVYPDSPARHLFTVAPAAEQDARTLVAETAWKAPSRLRVEPRVARALLEEGLGSLAPSLKELERASGPCRLRAPRMRSCSGRIVFMDPALGVVKPDAAVGEEAGPHHAGLRGHKVARC